MISKSIITLTTHNNFGAGGFITEVAIYFTVLVVILHPVPLSVRVTWEGVDAPTMRILTHSTDH